MITYDQGSEFIGHHFKNIMEDDYGVKTRPITVRNPQANAMLERIHQVVGNLIGTFDNEERAIDHRDPWTGVLNVAALGDAWTASIW